MGVGESLARFSASEAAQRVFGEPYDRPDGATVIPVARITGGNHPKAIRWASSSYARRRQRGPR